MNLAKQMKGLEKKIASLVAGALCLVALAAFLYYGRGQVAVGIGVGYVLSLAYFGGLYRAVGSEGSGPSAASRLKLLAIVRMLLLGIVLLVMGFFLPQGLWGFFISFTLVFIAFLASIKG